MSVDPDGGAVHLAHGPLRAMVVPDAGMVCTSLTLHGEELLWSPGPVASSLAAGRLLGVPLLHPWANRLSADRFMIEGRPADLSAVGSRVRRDPAGLGLHGLRPAAGSWEIVDRSAQTVRALLRYGRRPGELDVFPFPHVLELVIGLEDRGLRVETVVTALDGPVPVAFGFHPFLTLPGVPRDAWRIALPERKRVDLDAGCLPLGTRSAASAETLDLSEGPLDDAIAGLAEGATLALTGGAWRIALVMEAGYPCAQLFAPPAAPIVSLEPMTAPIDALVSGRGFRLADPVDRSVFTLTIDKKDVLG